MIQFNLDLADMADRAQVSQTIQPLVSLIADGWCNNWSEVQNAVNAIQQVMVHAEVVGLRKPQIQRKETHAHPHPDPTR